MKKILLSLAALAFAATINAQVWIGGEVGFNLFHGISFGAYYFF